MSDSSSFYDRLVKGGHRRSDNISDRRYQSLKDAERGERMTASRLASEVELRQSLINSGRFTGSGLVAHSRKLAEELKEITERRANADKLNKQAAELAKGKMETYTKSIRYIKPSLVPRR